MDKKEAYNLISKTIKELGEPYEYLTQDVGLYTEDIEDKDIASLFEGQVEVHNHNYGNDDCQTVWHFPKPDIYISFYGWYASHSGYEYEGMKLVEPKQVTVTQYHTVK